MSKIKTIFTERSFPNGKIIGDTFYCKIDESLRFRAVNVGDLGIEFSAINRERGVVDKIIVEIPDDLQAIRAQARDYMEIFKF